MNRRTTIISALAVSATVLLAGCGGSDTDDADVATADAEETVVATADVPYGLVDPATAAELAGDDSIIVIDVRTPEEYAEGHIADAVLIDLSASDFADRVGELDPDGTYLVYCRSGNRSAQAVAIMNDIGLDQVYDMQGGVVAYETAGLPLER